MQEKVFIKNEKGLKLATIIERPRKKGKLPTVLMFHGFKGYKEEAQYSELSKELLKKNIASARFDASGFGESEGNFEKDYRLTNYINDACRIYEYIIHESWVDKERVGVMGHSLGGAVAFIIAAKLSQIKVLVSVSPPDTYAMRIGLGKKIFKWIKKGHVEIDSSRRGKIGIPFSFALDAIKYDIRKYAAKVKAEKLFILGEEDITVVPDQTMQVYNHARKPKSLVKIKTMQHGYNWQPEILQKVNKKIVEFFVENL